MTIRPPLPALAIDRDLAFQEIAGVCRNLLTEVSRDAAELLLSEPLKLARILLQMSAWPRDSLVNLELQRRRVADCELFFLSRTLGVSLTHLPPRTAFFASLELCSRSAKGLPCFQP